MQMGVSSGSDFVFKEVLKRNVSANNASLYVWSVCFYESKGRLHDALTVYHLGICRSVLLDSVSHVLVLMLQVVEFHEPIIPKTNDLTFFIKKYLWQMTQ